MSSGFMNMSRVPSVRNASLFYSIICLSVYVCLETLQFLLVFSVQCGKSKGNMHIIFPVYVVVLKACVQ